MLSETDKQLIAYVHNDVLQNKVEILIMGSEKFIKGIVNGVKTEALSQGKHVPEQHINKLTKIYTRCIENVLGVDFFV
jgi:hypothetical protein